LFDVPQYKEKLVIAILKNSLKALRATQPINYLATSVVRAAVRATGAKPDYFLRRLPRVGTVRAPLPNGHFLSFATRGDDGIPNQIYWRGWDGYEPETIPIYFQLASKAHVTLDVGAHVGTFSLLAGHANPAGRVFAFEPLPANFRRLQQNVTLNGLTNVQCIEAAVSNKDGTAEFFTSDAVTIPDMSSLEQKCIQESLDGAYQHQIKGPLRKLSVKVVTLDQIVQQYGIPRVDLAKIDAEGVDPQVVEGMANTLRRDRPNLIIEVLRGFDTAERLETILRSHGYSFYLLTKNGPVQRDKVEGQPDGHHEWRNYLFTSLDPAAVQKLWTER